MSKFTKGPWILKKYNGIKEKDGWEYFSWAVNIKGIPIVYRMGLGHHIVSKKRPVGCILGNEVDSNKITKKHLGFSERIFIKIPKARDVLYSLASDASLARESFEDFCLDLGYDTDSRKVLELYLECQESGHKLRKMGYSIDRILSWEL